MTRQSRRLSTPLLPGSAQPGGAEEAIIFETATVARTLDRLIAGRLQDMEMLRTIALELKAAGGNVAMHRQLLALARSAREAVDDLQNSRAILVDRHRQASGGEIVAAVDAGTGLANHAAFATRLSEMLAELQTPETLSLMIVEVGALQLLANQAGHAIANRIVRRFAVILRRALKRGDYVARIAPHQFAIIFEDILPQQAAAIGLRLHEVITRKMSPSGDAITDVLSINMGIAGATGSASAPGPSAEDLVAMARAALSEARGEGRPSIYVA